jgi:radical SAM protein with 4Fe4S-binding SPASM domain
MLDIDSIPYFPLDIKTEKNTCAVENPIKNIKYDFNLSAYYLLQMCDGYHTIREISKRLSDFYSLNESRILKESIPIIKDFVSEGILWIRKQRMNWFDLPAPENIFWDLTSRCNLSCRHCVVNAGKKSQRELTLSESFELIEDLGEFGVKSITLSGGEPLIHPDIMKIIEYISDHSIAIRIATNGTLLTKSSAKLLSKYSVGIQVSLDGSTALVHDGFRRKNGAFRAALEGINHLCDYNLPFTIGTVVTQHNYEDIPAIYNLATDLGAEHFRLIPFIPSGRGQLCKELEINPNQMLEITQYLVQQRSEGKLSVLPMEFECTLSLGGKSTDKLHPQTHIGCNGAISTCTITSNGTVLPCNFFQGVKAENIRNSKFSWIWKNSRFLNYFRSLNVSDLQGYCPNCQWLSLCRGSCRAVNFTTGALFHGNSHCWVSKS